MASRDLLRIAAQYRKKSYTNDPGDDNYLKHFATLRPADEPVVAAYPGTAQKSGTWLKPKQTVTVVKTEKNYYIDTPSVQRVGPAARIAGGLLDRSGMSNPYVIPLDAASVVQPQPNRIVIQAPTLPTVTARTDGFVGRPAALSAGDQLRNLASMFRK
jgi:hypothetical protein